MVSLGEVGRVQTSLAPIRSTLTLKGLPRLSPNATVAASVAPTPFAASSIASATVTERMSSPGMETLTGVVTVIPAPPANVTLPFVSTTRSTSNVSFAPSLGNTAPRKPIFSLGMSSSPSPTARWKRVGSPSSIPSRNVPISR